MTPSTTWFDSVISGGSPQIQCVSLENCVVLPRRMILVAWMLKAICKKNWLEKKWGLRLQFWGGQNSLVSMIPYSHTLLIYQWIKLSGDGDLFVREDSASFFPSSLALLLAKYGLSIEPTCLLIELQGAFVSPFPCLTSTIASPGMHTG